MQMVPVPLQSPFPVNGTMTLAPGALFHPGNMQHHCGGRHHKQKCHCKKKKKKKESDSESSDSESDDEVYYYVRRNGQNQYNGSNGKKPLYLESRGVNGGGGRGRGRGPGGPAGLGASRKYEIFAPSHPQAVNQYVRDYNYKVAQQQKSDHSQALQEYNKAVAQYQNDRMADDYAAAVDQYNLALDDNYGGYDDYDYGYDDYGYDDYGYDDYYDDYY